ncbi:hypothetical protein ABT236_02105 [Streptomyces sp. NPDC001523]|uniref:terpene synthase family protein n=1 Tax=Streptomyces sp. NPDC001523 TaxID=3154383 RepID=UPI00331D8112
MTSIDRPSRIGRPLPAFYCPLDTGLVHPRAKELEALAVDWLDSHGIHTDPVERAWSLATHSADFSSRIVPHGDDTALLLFIEWNFWANAVDDWQDSGADDVRTAAVTDHGARLLRTIETPGAGLLPDGPMTRALEDLVTRTHALLTPFELRRFTEGTRDWLLGAAWEAANAERGLIPGLADFAAMGTLANGTRFSLTWADVANRVRPAPDVLYAPEVRALTDAAGFVVSADNDLFSYDKDDHVEPREVNLINVIAHQEGLTPARAVPVAVALRDRVMGLFLRLRQQVARDADEQLARHLEGMGHYIAGCLAWQDRAPRYASPRNRNELPVEGARFDIRYRDGPSDDRTEAPPLPALAWWWDLLDG